jgi:hypothetical protein
MSVVKDLDNVGMQVSAQFIDCTYFVVDILIVNFSKWTDQLSGEDLTVSFKNKLCKADRKFASACSGFSTLLALRLYILEVSQDCLWTYFMNLAITTASQLSFVGYILMFNFTNCPMRGSHRIQV